MKLHDPAVRVKAALVLLVLSIVAWPVTSFTVFKSDPQGLLALSWLALIFEMPLVVVTTDVRNNQ